MVNREYLKQLNILYVEDEFEAKKKLEKLLSRLFDNIIFCANGKEAFEIFESKNIDLVISDINMPVMDGLELASKIREINKDIPIIFTTARNESDCLVKAIDLSVDAFILKPINFETLVEKIDKAGEKIELLESKRLLEEYKEVVDSSSIIYKFDLDGKITFANTQYEEQMLYKRKDVLDRFFNFNFLEDNTKEFFDELWETIESGNIWRGKLKGRTKEKKSIFLETTILPVINRNEGINEYIAISTDITQEESLNTLLKGELKKSEKVLSNKNYLISEYKRCFDISSIFIAFDTNYNISYVNSKFIELTKEKEEKFLGEKISSIFTNSLVYKQLLLVLEEQDVYKKVLKIKDSKGKLYHIDFIFSPIFNELGEVIEYLAIGNDVSELLTLHEEIESVHKALKD